MAGRPQKYVLVENEFLDFICAGNLRKRELKILLFLIRESLGRSNSQSWMTTKIFKNREIAHLVNMGYHAVTSTIQTMAQRNIIVIIQEQKGCRYLINPNPKEWLPKGRSFRRIRSEVLERDHYTCVYCGSQDNITVDHIIPRSRGGRDTKENLVACCWKCNIKKYNRTPEEAGMVIRGGLVAPEITSVCSN